MKTTSMGAPVRWTEPTIDFVVVPTGDVHRDRLLEAAAARAARSWSEIGEVMVHVSQGVSGTHVTKSFDPAASGENAIAWAMGKWTDDDDMLALTFLHYAAESGAILDADILVNDADFTWTDADDRDDEEAYDLANALTHEMGHALGLGHSDVLTATMYPTSASTEVSKRDLDGDDQEGVRTIYASVVDPDEQLAPELVTPYGCQAMPVETPWIALIAVLISLAWARRQSLPVRAPALARAARRSGPFLAAPFALALAAAASPAHASPEGPSVEAIVARAEAIADVEVVSQKVELQDGLRVTVSVLRVQACRSGRCPRMLVLEQLGGELDGIGLIAEGITPVKTGDALTIAARSRGARWRMVGRDRGVLLDLKRPDPLAKARLDRLVRDAR